MKKGLFLVGILAVVISSTRGDNTSLEPKCEEQRTNSSTKCLDPPEPGCLSQFNYNWPHTTAPDKYYACENGVRSQMSCSEGKLFNPVIQECDDFWNLAYKTPNVKCDQTYMQQENPHYYYICRNGVPTLEYCRPPYIFDTNRNSCVDSFNCIHNMSYYVTHESDEQMYYRCDFGEKRIHSCPPRYPYFDDHLYMCKKKEMEIRPHQCMRNRTYNWPHETRSDLYYTCTMGSISTNHCSNGTFSSVLLKCVPEVLNRTVYIEICNSTISIGDDSNIYFRCRLDVKLKLYCPPYALFHLELQLCVWKDNVYFGLERLPKSTWYQQHNCSENKIYRFPHESRSDMYYHCHWGRRSLQSCPEGTMFHSRIKKCVSVHRSEVTGKCENGLYNFRHKKTNLYYNCYHGIKRILFCPSSTLFDSEHHRCMSADETECDHLQRYRIDNDTTKYYRCYEGVRYLDICGPNRHYHPKRQRCIEKELCDPERDYNEPHEISRDLYYHCHFGGFTLKACPVKMTFSMKVKRCVKQCSVVPYCPPGHDHVCKLRSTVE